jgi:transposase
LHGLDPEVYLRAVFRVLPYWPRERFLELSPHDWTVTRARLAPAELEHELGPIAVPEPTASSPEDGFVQHLVSAV